MVQRHHALRLLLGHHAHRLRVGSARSGNVGSVALVGAREAALAEAAVVDALRADAVEDFVTRAVDGAGLEVLLQLLVPLRARGGGGLKVHCQNKAGIRKGASGGSRAATALLSNKKGCTGLDV